MCRARVGARETAASGHKRAPQNQNGQGKKGRRHRRDQEATRGRGPDGPQAETKGQDPEWWGGPRRANMRGSAGLSLWNTTSAGTMLRLRATD